MQGVGTGALVDRMIGVARLDVPTYEEIEHDERATTPALLVVVLAAIAGGIGSLGEGGIGGLFGGIVASILLWAVFSGVAYFVGTRLLATAGTSSSWQEVMRTLGFAYTPSLLTVVGFIPILGPVIAAVAGGWFLVTATIALRQSLDMTTGRAIGTAVISIIPSLLIAGSILAIFGIGR